jgi:predicted dehydrogenase
MGIIHGHLLQVHPDTEVVGFVDRDAGLAAHLASQGLRAPLYPSLAALNEKAAADAVFVCTPTHTHLPVVREALGRRVHLFVEKPVATNRDDAEAILRLATEAGRGPRGRLRLRAPADRRRGAPHPRERACSARCSASGRTCT